MSTAALPPPRPAPGTARGRERAGGLAAVSDGGLVGLALGGDNRARAELYRRHHRAARTAAAAWSHDRSTAEDVVHDAFLRAFERLGSLRRPDGFRPWLLQITRNVATDRRRRDRFDLSLDADDAPVAVSGDDPAERSELRAIARSVTVLLHELPPAQAAALAAVGDTGSADYDHLAVLLGTSPANARLVIHRARRRLRAQLMARWGIDASFTTRPPSPEDP